MTRARRWLPVAAAAVATVVLATGFGLTASQLATPRAQNAPHLKTVSTAALSRLGISLSAHAQPVYCGLAGVAASRGWLRQGAAGCAISRDAAESAARQGRSGRVLESVLALVNSTRLSSLGRDLLAWVVVAQQPLGACRIQIAGASICASRGGFTWTQIVLVDAYRAGVLSRLRVSAVGGTTVPAVSGTTVPSSPFGGLLGS